MVRFNFHDLSHSIQESVSTLASCFCQPDATLKLNGRTFKIVKLLGEGGFSYVYLAQDPSSGRLFALKKIRCPLGSDSVKDAIKEVEAYRRFRHPNIIRCLDSCVVQDKDGDGKVVYLFLPYYSRGNLQDLVNLHTDLSPIPESEILRYFLGTAKAVRAIHRHVPKLPRPPGTDSYPPNTHRAHEDSLEDGLSPTVMQNGSLNRKGKERQNDEEEEEEEEEQFGGEPTEEEDQKAPLMGQAVSDDHAFPAASATGGCGDGLEPWAHRDLKPANVMISDDGQPILMDFGSALKARIEIPSRSVALQQQDLAAEHSSMPYRAPELFDVKTGESLTEAVDIWSLGCVLYCLAYGHSPFETTDTVEQGGSMALAVMNGSWKFPSKDLRGYGNGLKELIREMLVVEPSQRPTIEKVIEKTEEVLSQLSA